MMLPCAVTRDLLPLYAEGMVEKETGELIKAHLSDCPDCRQKLSGLKTAPDAPIETAEPLQSLKKQLRKRRLYAAAIAGLCVFVAVFTWFYHASEWKQVPWEEGMITAVGIERRPRNEIYDQEAFPDEAGDMTLEVLVLRVDSRINGNRETVFRDEDGTETVLLQGWTTNFSGKTEKEYGEMVICPVPDRLIYDGGEQQRLIWGKPLNGGVETLPRLALGFYLILAAALAAVSGSAWFLLRGRGQGRIARQIFFAPLAWLASHFMIKGARTSSFFMERDFIGILLLALALYALMTLSWQALMRRRKEQ